MEALDRCRTARTPVFFAEDVWHGGTVDTTSAWRVQRSSGGWAISKSSCETVPLMMRLS